MPQMAPYNWLILYLLINSLLILYSSYIYFIKIPSFNSSLVPNIEKYLWKW